MGIRLDWQIDAERVYKREGEDPDSRKRRRRRRFQIVLVVMSLLIFMGAVAGLIWYRLATVDKQLQQTLIDAAKSEVDALRRGDYAEYVSLQRSSDDWIKYQIDRYHHYQDLVTHSQLTLTGNIVDATVDGSRGRVIVEEDVQNIPYHTIWFFWRFSDGWRHVPSDYTFWGDAHQIAGKVSTVNYDDVDTAFARNLATLIDSWWAQGCDTLACATVPKLTVDVVADPLTKARWDDQSVDTLRVASPLATDERAPADASIPSALEDAIVAQIVDRQFDIASSSLQPVPTADAAWLRQMIVEWLAYKYTGHGAADQVSFVQSLNDRYGPAAIGSVVHRLYATADISVVGVALNKPLDSLAVDWRTFFQWRLDVEKTLLNDRLKFQALWDVGNPVVVSQMQQRMQRPSQATPQVQAVTMGTGPRSVPMATLQVVADGKPQVIIFRLINGSWKRSA